MSKKFIIIIVILIICFTAANGETIKEGSIAGQPIIAVELGYTLEPGNDENILTWNKARERLLKLKEYGVNTIFLWAPYEHPQIPIKTIPVWKERNGKAIKVNKRVAQWNVVNLHAKNYLKTDPRRGTEEDFQEFINEAHRLGMVVIGQFIATGVSPESLFCQEHPEWLLRKKIGGQEYPVMTWPMNWGYAVNKSDPEFIKYVTDTVMPYWINKWNLDGIFIDSPGMPYNESEVRAKYEPVKLSRAMREKIEAMKKETGRNLILIAENPDGSHLPKTAGIYYDFVWGYESVRAFFQVKTGSVNSNQYITALKKEIEGRCKFTKIARFICNLNAAGKCLELLRPQWVPCYITLNVTAPGNIVWVGVPQWDINYDEKWCEFFLDRLGIKYKPGEAIEKVKQEVIDIDLIWGWYEKIVKIKREHPALQSDNIEDALVSPKIKRLIAYNRWLIDESLTVIVNADKKELDCIIKTRSSGNKVILKDLLSGEEITGNPEALKVRMPGYGTRILSQDKVFREGI